MPRAKKDEGAEPKKRSRTGCWPCKARKVKCGEERPVCANCIKNGETCDYSIRLNWGGRVKRDQKEGSPAGSSFTFMATPSSVSSATAAHEHVFSSQHIATPSMQPTSHPAATSNPPTSDPHLAVYDPRLTGSAQVSPLLTYRETTPPQPDFSPERTSKRMRMSPRNSAIQSARSALQNQSQDHISPNSNNYTSSSIDSVMTTPVATPGSSITSVSPFPAAAVPMSVQDPPDLRRLSVKSLLADPLNQPERPLLHARHESHTHRHFGYDHGLPDEDIPRNNDQAVLQPLTPDMRRPSLAQSEVSVASADGRNVAFEAGGYYANPVAVKLSKSLDPLPQELLRNPMSLLYFHFFINHTSRIMVPHDCAENPLRRVLPRMAVRNPQLLHLVLAFAASNRARLLGHPQPSGRIAEWMSDVVPALRQALDRPITPRGSDTSDLSTLAPLCTAIMLASLEIMAPKTFEVPISWQNHLDVARQLIINLGGLGQFATRSDGGRDSAVWLISRWFAYLDILGSLSSGKHRQPLIDAYMEDGGGVWLVNRSAEEVHRIDCFLGFSGTCIALLAQVATLASECGSLRIDPATGEEIVGWQPPAYIVKRADELYERLQVDAIRGVPSQCMQSDADNEHTMTLEDRDEIFATNQAFHWGGMIHLSRRILALPRTHAQVQDGVQKVLQALTMVRRGSSAEACLLFPMFSAGSEALTASDRQAFLARIESIESWGMQHMMRARRIMQKSWETGEPWEALVHDEFFG